MCRHIDVFAHTPNHYSHSYNLTNAHLCLCFTHQRSSSSIIVMFSTVDINNQYCRPHNQAAEGSNKCPCMHTGQNASPSTRLARFFLLETIHRIERLCISFMSVYIKTQSACPSNTSKAPAASSHFSHGKCI